MEWRTTVNMRKAHEKKEFGYTIHRAQRGETLSAWMEDVFFFYSGMFMYDASSSFFRFSVQFHLWPGWAHSSATIEKLTHRISWRVRSGLLFFLLGLFVTPAGSHIASWMFLFVRWLTFSSSYPLSMPPGASRHFIDNVLDGSSSLIKIQWMNVENALWTYDAATREDGDSNRENKIIK